MAQLVKFEVADALATITLARAEAGNAMSRELLADLDLATQVVAADPAVRAVLVVAEGKNFCVGGDIRSFSDASDPGAFIEGLAESLPGSLRRLAALDAPMVTAVRGAAAGAGLSLAIAGDVVIAGAGASFATAYLGLGLTSDGGATWSLPRLIGLRRAQEMAYANRRVLADEAERWGLVTRVVADEAVEEEAFAVARRIAEGPTRGYGGVKRLLRGSYGASFSDQLDAEVQAIGAAMRTEDAQGAVRAFLAREKPVFTGR